MDLADYEHSKFDMAEILRAVAEPGSPLGPANEERHRELFARLAEDRFNLAVVGRSSRGKSSLMNAIFGSDHLPTDIVPLTSVITSVGYGSEPCAVILFEGALLRHEVKLETLAHYVTQQGNPGNIQRVKFAEVQLPAEILRRGFYCVDTPGVGSAITANTRTTEEFLPASDAMLLVTGFDGPLSDDEVRLLEWAHAFSRRVFVAVNKHDTVGPQDRQRTLDYVRGELADRFDVGQASVFSTSATDGLKAKLDQDAKALAESGIPDLERALIAFLVEHKRSQFLHNMCARIDAVLAELPPTPHRQALMSRLRDLVSGLDGAETAQTTEPSIGGLAPARPEAAGTCEVCRATDEATFDFLRHFQYEMATSEAEQARLAEEGGLCPLHSWWLYNLASPHGLSVGLPRLLERWSRALADLADNGTANGKAAASFLEANRSGNCPACQEAETAQSDSLAELANELNHDGAVDELSAICLWHLPALLRLTNDDNTTRRVLRRQAGLFERTAEDMRRYAVKREGLRRTLLSRSEEQSSLRSIRLLAGLQNLRFVTRRE